VRYAQDRELFGFFVAGLSAVESFYYGLYAIASMMDSATFPMETFKDKRKVKPEETTIRYEEHNDFGKDTMILALRKVLDDPKFKEWEGFRNILAHQVVPGRELFLSTGTASSDPARVSVELKSGVAELVISTDTTSSRRTWLAMTLNVLLAEAEAFTTRHAARLPPECS